MWNSKSQACLYVFGTGVLQAPHLHQHSITSCPVNDVPVDGGFSEWGEWRECAMQGGEKCECRARVCDAPRPRKGGKSCDETKSIEIRSCK